MEFGLQGGNTMTTVLPQGSEQDEETTELWNILFRRQHLQNRLQFLQEIQKRNSKIEGNSLERMLMMKKRLTIKKITINWTLISLINGNITGGIQNRNFNMWLFPAQ